MREGWEYKKLGEVCENIDNISWADVDDNQKCQYIDLSAVNRDSFSIDNTTPITKNDAPSRAKQIVKKGDVLFGTTRPLLKRVCIVPSENDGNICSTGFCVLRPNTNKSLSKWLFYQLLSEKYYEYIEPLQSGANYPAVSDKIVKSFRISMPDLSVQQQIVYELDLLSGVIEKQKAQLEELDKLAQSIFYDMFGDPLLNEKGWATMAFGDIYKLKSGDGLSAKQFEVGPYPVYGGNGISGYHSSFNMDGNYIVIGRVGVYCGNVRNVIGKFWLTDNAFQLFYDKEKQNSVFITFLLTYLNLHQYANHAAQPVISNSTLKDVQTLFPPLSLQQEFAAKVEAIESMKAKVRQSLTEAETLFNSRMDYYFN